MRNLVYLPDVNMNTFLLLNTKKEAATLRAYPRKDYCEVLERYTRTQVLEMLKHTDAIRLPADDDIPKERTDQWFARIAALNHKYGRAGPPLP